jgi:hypothetical protein
VLTRTHALSALLLLALLGGCASTAAAARPAGPAPAVRLTATLVSPTNVTLSWHDSGPAPAGAVVEYATTPNGPFTPLGFLPPTRTTFQHSDLMPTTTFYYRVRPFYGPASRTVDVSLPPGAYDDQAQSDQSWAAPRAVPGGPVATQSIRNASRAAAGAPTNLTATIVNANGIKLAWTDHASDADGYLVESKPVGGTDFNVIQLLGPDIDTCGVVTLPTEKNATYLIRAFYYGHPSNTAHRTTGGGP